VKSGGESATGKIPGGVVQSKDLNSGGCHVNRTIEHHCEYLGEGEGTERVRGERQRPVAIFMRTSENFRMEPTLKSEGKKSRKEDRGRGLSPLHGSQEGGEELDSQRDRRFFLKLAGAGRMGP